MIGRKLIILALVAFCFSTGFAGLAMAQNTETVYIGEGDYYSLGPYYGWGTSDLWVNMSVIQGGNVDIYVMSSNQYYNAYSSDTYLYEQGGQEPGGIAFKSNSRENVSQANIYHHMEIDINQEMWGEDDIWVIIDNRNTNATPNDATPTGNVQVELEIKWITDEYDYFDDGFFWLEGILCVAGSLIPTVLIIVLLFLIYKKIGKKNDVTPPMQYYPHAPATPPQAPIAPAQPHAPVPPEPPMPPPVGQAPQKPSTPPEGQ